MGVDMVTMTLPLPLGREPDWDAAALAIRTLRLDVVWDADDLYPWEEWLAETENLPGSEAAFVALRAARWQLHRHACMLRGAIEHGWRAELVCLQTPTHRAWVSGGPSWGDDPGDLITPMIELAEAGITAAAGFEGHTQYVGPPIERRRLGFGAGDTRRVCMGLAAAHAAEQACGTAASLSSWPAELDRMGPGDAGGRALLRFVAAGLALCSGDPEGPARELAALADEWEPPRHDSWRAARDELRALAQALRARHPARPDPPRLAAEMLAGPLLAAVGALADLHGDAVGELIDVPPPEITPDAPPAGPGDLSRYLSLMATGGIDWAAAEQAVRPLPARPRAAHRRDLATLRDAMEAGYPRYLTSDRVGGHTLCIAAPTHGDEPDAAASIRRLGPAGVLEAAGVVSWSAPPPR
jgi:hypothetical protein